MDELTQLANALMALDDKLAACMKCGFCQAFCPMYMTTRIEGDLTRGKIALVENLAHRIIEDPEAVNEKLSRCLLCGSCQANCPSGVKTTDIFLEARAIVATYLGLSAIKKAAFRMLLPNPRLFGTLLRLSAPFQNLILKDEAKPQNTVCAPLLKPMLGDRHMPKLAAKPLHSTVGNVNTPMGKSRIKVAFFPAALGTRSTPTSPKPALRSLTTMRSAFSCPTTTPVAVCPRWLPAIGRDSKRWSCTTWIF